MTFDRFMADDIATVEQIYAVADQPFTVESRAAMEAFMDEHPRGRHGTVVYRPEAVGIDRAERYEALGPYIEQFGVTPEAPTTRVER